MAIVANDDSATTPFNTAVNVTVLANDLVDGAPATLALLAGPPTVTVAPLHGAAAVQGDGSITYTPTTGYSGADQFTYEIEEPGGGLVTPFALPTGLLSTLCEETPPYSQVRNHVTVGFGGLEGQAHIYGLSPGMNFTITVNGVTSTATWNASLELWDVVPPVTNSFDATVQIPGVNTPQGVGYWQGPGCN